MYKMEEVLELEAKKREKEVELHDEIERVNPIAESEMGHYDLIAYTDGACQRKKGE